MKLVTLPDITLGEYTLNRLGNLARLREELLAAPAEICIERARHITAYMKKPDTDPEKEPQLFRARAVRRYLENKAAVFPDDNLLAGTTGSRRKSAPIYPEFIGLTIWSELDTIGARPKNPQPLSAKDAKILNLEVFPYWMDRDVLSATKKQHGNDLLSARLLEKMVFFIAGKAGCISHTVPLFSHVLAQGLLPLIQEAGAKTETALGQQRDFYRAVATALGGVLEYARHLAETARNLAKRERDPQRKKRLTDMAAVCENVPSKPASTFREAVNSIWLCLIGIHAENINMAISPGRLDQVLYPYYRRDVDRGALSVAEAMELVGCLWLKLGDNVNAVPQVSEELFGGAGTAPAVTVGGVDEKGEDAVNDLTYIMLRVTELLKTREPNMNARYHYEKNSREYRDRVAAVIGTTKAIPAFHNDVANIATLQNQGTSLEHARDYAIIGCVELAAAGRSYDSSSSVMLNLAAPLELTLYQGRRPTTGDEVFNTITPNPRAFLSYAELWDAFTKQTAWLIDQAVDLNEKMAAIHQQHLPTPLLSALFDGPMEKGRDLIFGGARYNSSGATHIGFADIVDSLNAMRTAVFEDTFCTMDELLDALRTNFAGTPRRREIHQYLLNKAPKYGTAKESETGASRALIRFLYDTYQGYTNYRGGPYRPAYWTMTNHSGHGKITRALPSGRLAGKTFASGITPVSGASGSLTEALNAVAALNAEYIPGSVALNIKFTEIRNAQDARRLGDFVEGYFSKGGQQVQFNILSRALLEEARRAPEKHRDLLVRVSGYSAYFNDLNPSMQEELITRSEYDIETGKAVDHA
jgi:formate C-acetyltransferase